MLYTICIVLIVLWALGYFVFPVVALGSLIHVLLVIALIVLVLQLVTGRRPGV